jgi:hypothetical protein
MIPMGASGSVPTTGLGAGVVVTTGSAGVPKPARRGWWIIVSFHVRGSTGQYVVWHTSASASSTTRTGIRLLIMMGWWIAHLLYAHRFHKEMWFGTEKGVSRFDGSNWLSFTNGMGWWMNWCAPSSKPAMVIWVGTYPYARGAGGISNRQLRSPQKSQRSYPDLLPHLRNSNDTDGMSEYSRAMKTSRRRGYSVG